MTEVIQSLIHFLRRALSDLPGSIGSNSLGIWFPIVPAILVFFYQWSQTGWRGMKHDLIVGAVITATSYLLLFCYCVIRNLYREHIALVSKEKKTRMELEYLRDRPQWSGYASEQAWKEAINYQNHLIELGRSIDGILNPLQLEAVRTSTELLTFLIKLGDEPAPRYTDNEIVNLPSKVAERLISEQDGDYAEACAYHWEDERLFVRPEEGVYKDIFQNCNRLRPWYEQIRARYALDFRDEVERLRNRFALYDLSDEALLLAVEGSKSSKQVRAIAIALWSLAYRVGEKRIND